MNTAIKGASGLALSGISSTVAEEVVALHWLSVEAYCEVTERWTRWTLSFFPNSVPIGPAFLYKSVCQIKRLHVRMVLITCQSRSKAHDTPRILAGSKDCTYVKAYIDWTGPCWPCRVVVRHCFAILPWTKSSKAYDLFSRSHPLLETGQLEPKLRVFGGVAIEGARTYNRRYACPQETRSSSTAKKLSKIARLSKALAQAKLIVQIYQV